MKKQLLMLGLAVGSVFSTKAQSADIQWAKGFGATGTGIDNAASIAIDDAGNVYTAGLFTGTTDLDPGPGTFSVSASGAEREIYIQKLNANGDFAWGATFQNTQSKYPSKITVDPSGNVILVGRFRGTMDFDPGPGTANRTAVGLSGIPGSNDDAFIVKLDTDGNYMWATSMGQFNTDLASYVTTDAAGNIYTTGIYRNNVDFNPGSGTNVLTNNGGANIFIQKLSPNGDYIWARGYGGTSTDHGKAVVVDANQNVYLAATISSDNWAFDSNNLANSSHSVQGNGSDVVVLKLNQAGNFLWSSQVGGNSSEDVWGIALDNLEKPVITGTFSGSGDFNPGSGTFTLSTSGSTDAYTLKLNTSGDFEWATKIGGTSDDVGRGIATDAAGNSYTTGYFRVAADFDPGAGTDNRTSAGNREIFVQKLDTDGNYVWAKTIGGTGDDYGIALDHNAAGALVIAGFFSGTVDFEDGSGVTNLTSNGGRDAYVVKYFECAPETATDVITACGSYQWINGTTYTSDNNSAQVTLTNQAGCDSVVTLDLTISQPEATTDVITACGSYEWINGTTYTSDNNLAQVTLTNQAGCDSVVTLDLTINQPDATTDVITACGSYEWINGTTYTSDNNSAQVTLTNQAGCDSVVTLDLTINQPDATTDVITACGSYEWINGTTYTSNNNSAQVTLTNQAGCDSVVTLDLTINQPDATTDVISACESFEWINGTTYTSSNNSAQVTLTNQAGCDSVVTLDLTITQPDATTDVITACSSYEWIDGTTYTSDNNTAQVTLTNLAGCDSVVTLDLTINQPDATTDVITACDSYEWIDGTTYTSDNNTAQVTLTNQAGCDSVVTLDLTINSVGITSVMSTGNTISATNSGATFQWVDCDDNFAPIAGETGNSFTPASTGNYAVEVTNNGCTEITNCVSVMITSLNDQSLNERVSIYPQPSNGELSVNLGGLENVNLSVYGSNGQLVHQMANIQQSVYTMNLNQPAGLYVMLLEAEGNTARFKIVLK